MCISWYDVTIVTCIFLSAGLDAPKSQLCSTQCTASLEPPLLCTPGKSPCALPWNWIAGGLADEAGAAQQPKVEGHNSSSSAQGHHIGVAKLRSFITRPPPQASPPEMCAAPSQLQSHHSLFLAVEADCASTYVLAVKAWLQSAHSLPCRARSAGRKAHPLRTALRWRKAAMTPKVLFLEPETDAPGKPLELLHVSLSC